MELSYEELEWAHGIRQGFADSSTITRDITDYECGIWAITSMGRSNLDEVLNLAYQQQCFLEAYQLNGNDFQEGMRCLKGFFQQQPGVVLSIDCMLVTPNNSNFVVVMDYAKFNPQAAQTPRDWNTLISALFYINQIVTSSFHATRRGLITIFECQGLSFQNYSPQMEDRWHKELLQHYPIRHKDSYWLRPPTVAHIILACAKPFIRPETWSRIQLGCTLEGMESRLDQVFGAPTLEEAQQRMVEQIEIFLQQRIDRQTSYRLPPLEELDASEASEDDVLALVMGMLEGEPQE